MKMQKRVTDEELEVFEELADQLVDDLSEFFLNVFKNYDGPLDNVAVGAAATHAAFMFAVSTMISAEIPETEAHNKLNMYYSNMTPFVERVKKAYQN